MTIIVPAKTQTDFKIIEHLANRIWTEHYTPIIGKDQVSYMLQKFQSAAAIEDQVQNGMVYYLLIYEDKEVGYFSFSRQEGALFLSKIYVLNSLRGRGIGSATISFLEKQAKKLDLHKIKLTVNRFNSSSIKAYEKMGFKNVGTTVQDIGGGFVMDDFILEKPVK
ncbi:GNAT family N-acetyltransferase [Salegentibacter chungangensis]|uniref:GNAT family N-acetyltransferase n=1 Tax=Salegentibacter chungangensis TaxID=1335724 RepID=A0ABW3NP96_9FLAO